MLRTSTFAVLAVLLLFNFAWGQYYGPWGGYQGASTVEGDWARGLADIVRSQGQYNLATSRAAINVEEARAKYIENRSRAQEVYFDMRRRNEAFREDMRGPRVTSEQIFRINSQRAPKRLTDEQLDPVTGELTWPFLLTSEIYAPYRQILDRGFVQRTQEGSFSSPEVHQKIMATADELGEALKARIRTYEPQQYIEASKFVEALAYDARFPAG